MKRMIAIAVMVGLLVSGVVYFRHATSPVNPTAGAARAVRNERAPVTITTARRRAIRQSLTLVGVLKTDQRAAISAKVPGKVQALLVRDGQAVRRGQPLARLDIGDARAQISGAQAAVSAAKAQLSKAVIGKRARATELNAQISQATGGMGVAKAKLTQAELGVQLNGSSARSDAERAAAAVRQAEAGVRQADTAFSVANETYKRTKFLFEHGGVAKADLEGAEAQLDIARAQRDAALAALDQARSAATPATESAPLRAKVSEADVAAAQAGVTQAQQGLANARRAKEEALRIADQDVNAAQAQYAQAVAGRDQALAQIGNGTLTSPIDGVVTDMTAHVGDMAQPGMPLLNVVSHGKVFLEVGVNVVDGASIHPGQEARVTIESMPGRSFDGEVTEVLPVNSQDNRTVPIRIAIDPQGARLTPGISAKAEINISQNIDSITVPVDALRSEGNTSYVYVVKQGVATRRNLELGGTEGAHIQVLSGLAEGDEVIISGPTSLQTGAAVDVVAR